MLTALYAENDGQIYDAAGIGAVAFDGAKLVKLQESDLIQLPEGSELMYLPGRIAIGVKDGQIVNMQGQFVVAAMLPVGYTRTLLPAYEKQADAPRLPLYGYAPVAVYKDRLYTAAIYSDHNHKWNPAIYNTRDLNKKVAKLKQQLPQNRLVEHLGHCALTWHCCTAQNLFYHRWEAGIPVSPTCNANCLGCISLQPSECCPSPQGRIKFTPTVEEIAEIGTYHLSSAPEPIISFGQGCEGEPSLESTSIAQAISFIRSKTKQGQINMNTNAGYTKGIQEIVDSGIDSIRVSIISARREVYQAYYRANYELDAVIQSIAYAKKRGVYVSLNMLLFPGLNDRQEEVVAWIDFLRETGIDMVQLRNLNIDPDWFLQKIPPLESQPIGTKNYLQTLQTEVPHVQIGSFSHYVK